MSKSALNNGHISEMMTTTKGAENSVSFLCFSDTTRYCTWWLMTARSVISLLTVSICVCIVFLPLSTYSTPSSNPGPRTMMRSSFAPSMATARKPNVTILMMFPDIDRFIPNLKSLLIVYEYIIHRYNISQWLNVNLQVKDSNCSISLAPHMLVTTMLSTIPDVVFGPFCGKRDETSQLSMHSTILI